MANLTTNYTNVTPSVATENSLWGKIMDFYSDNNNMAMYLVLPLIVIVYGGCSLIFCIHKCMQYCKKTKRKKDKKALLQGNRKNSIVTERLVGNRPRSLASIHPEINQTNEQKRETTPLPWQIPDESETEQKKTEVAPLKGNTSSHKVTRTHTGKTPPPPYKEVDDTIYLSGPQHPGYPSSGHTYHTKKQEYSPLELTKQLLRIGEDDKNIIKGRKKRLVFTTD
ncbi:uncharacterized protein LOC133179918 [Saccostrea echinata]|uniref:uncharacterized protein LOC133179918 n=1 Tax=Saccostrea echinata TaxID=191078 RepID=UPI002A828086|nr:uncharacterized protein LOC133179918 [Saccostrea echinata]